MIKEEERNILIKYRLEQAKGSVDEADILIKNQKYSAAVNRIYYGMFYSLLALALKYRYETSKHQQLHGWFNKNFIHTKKIDPIYAKMINHVFKSRIIGDYDTFIKFSEKDVISMHNDMKEFITAIENFINSEK